MTIEVFYDRYEKVWTVIRFDDNGVQIDNCDYTHTKKEALAVAYAYSKSENKIRVYTRDGELHYVLFEQKDLSENRE